MKSSPLGHGTQGEPAAAHLDIAHETAQSWIVRIMKRRRTPKNLTPKDIRDLVERVRAGDQIAMSVMAQVRDRAKGGNAQAKVTLGMLERYVRTTPAGHLGGAGNSTMGADLAPVAKQAQSDLWRWRLGRPQEFAVVVAKCSPLVSVWQAVVAVMHGPRLGSASPLMTTSKVKGSKIGAIVRQAFVLQGVRDGRMPISRFCAATGWEHGE